jgi:hypothetical protein
MEETIKSPLSILDSAQSAMYGDRSNINDDVTKVEDHDNEEDDNSVSNLDPKNDDDTLDDVPEDALPKDEPVEETEEKHKTNKKDFNFKDEEEEKDDNTSGTDTKEDDESDEVDATESENVGAFFDAFSESLGWEVDEENKPDTVEGLVDYIKDLVTENSTPEYSSDEVKNLDEFIKNGGKFEDYYNRATDTVNYDTIDIEDEDNQKNIVRDYLKRTGFSDSQINKKLEKFEDAGLLEDEANDDLELLKNIAAKEKTQLLKSQEEAKHQQVEQQQKFFTDITTSIDSLDDFRGIKVPKEDRSKLKDYLFKTDSDGHSHYEKDW